MAAPEARASTFGRPGGTDMWSWLLRSVGVLLLLSALGLSLSRAPDRAVQTLVARWAPPPSDFVDVNGMVVHLRDEGPRDDALPLLLLHGTSASLHTWEGWVRALKTQRRVISLDLPGFGLTGPFAGSYAPDDYRGDSYARFVLDLMDQLKINRAVLAGNSLGGEIAWRVATLAPQRVASLVLVDASGLQAQPQSVPIGLLIARAPVFSQIAEWVLPRALITQGLASVYGDPAKVTTDLVDRYFELALREGNRRALGHRLRQMTAGDELSPPAARIDSIKQPTLILWGGLDKLVPLAAGHDFHRRIAGSQLVVLEGLGHVPQEEDPARTVAPVKVFLGLK